MIRRLRAIPRPLALILAVAAIEGLAWCAVMPPLQGPDEDSHFSYVQQIVDKGTIPWQPGGGSVRQLSTELYTVENVAGLGPLTGNLGARPYWTRADQELWRRADAGLAPDARSNGGYNSALRNPPLYYLYAAVPYEIASSGSIFDREIVVRLANVPLMMIALVFVWLVAGELVGRGWPQVLATAAAGLVPQLTNMTATVNPDVLLTAEWSAALYLMLLVLRRGPRRWPVVGLAAVCVAAALTHARSLPLFVPAGLAVAIAVARERGWRRASPIRLAGAVTALYALIVLVLAGQGSGNVRQFGSYVWQFYLPRLGFMNPTIGPPNYGFREAYVDRLYGTLAQLEVVLPHRAEQALWLLSVVALVALVVVLVRSRDAVRRRLPEFLVLLSAILALLLGLHLAAYRAMLGNPGDPIVTARYLLPLLPLFGAAIALIAGALRPRAAAVFTGLVLAGGVVLQLESLGLLVERFYA